MASPQSQGKLDELRNKIDVIDQELIHALSRRAELVVEVGNVKREGATAIYAPHREQEVLKRVLDKNPGPLSDRTVEAIYRELMSGSFSLEHGLSVGFLGPEGSFSHMAARRHFGSSVEFSDLHTIEGVFEEVAKKHVDYGLVPYENSIGGGITDTLDAFQEYQVHIYTEAMIEVSHCLLANCEPPDVQRIYSKPQIFDQCRRWLANRFPGIGLVATASSAEAVKTASQESGAAAIGSELAGEIYNVKRIYEKIQDKPNNITRFLVISNQPAERSGNDKTTLMFVTAHKPGALVDVLTVFRDREINLSHIDKRPSGRTNWEYTFFIDCEAHRTDEHMIAAIQEAETHCRTIQVLGSYPRAVRVL